MAFERPKIDVLRQRLNESPQFMVVVAGPRQVGKTTMVRQVLADFSSRSRFVATDEAADSSFVSGFEAGASYTPIPGAASDAEWLVLQWQRARNQARALEGDKPFVLAIDEIQKIPRWSEIVM